MKGDVKRKSFSADWSGEFSLASSPPLLMAVILNTRVRHLFSTCGRASRRSSGVVASWCEVLGNADQGSIRGSKAYGFFRSCEEA